MEQYQPPGAYAEAEKRYQEEKGKLRDKHESWKVVAALREVKEAMQ